MRVSSYERPAWDRESTVEIWRYAWRDQEGRKYVYSGKYLALRVGEIVSLRASIKCERDSFGFCRLSRLTNIERGRKCVMI